MPLKFMKKLYLLIFLLPLSSSVRTASAQTSSPIGQRNYIGVEAGMNYGWQGGAENFVIEAIYPYHQENGPSTVFPLAFKSLGSGIGFRLGATLDLNLTDKFSFAGSLHYYSQTTKSVEAKSVNYSQAQSEFYQAVWLTAYNGAADFQNTIEQSLNYLGGNLLLRFQIVPESWYAFAGLEINAAISNTISMDQTILVDKTVLQYKEYETIRYKGSTVRIGEQEAKDLYKSLWLGPKVGVGTFIPIGSNGWVIAPEVSLSIPLTDLYNSEYTVIQDPNNRLIPLHYDNVHSDPRQFSKYNSTTPKLWFAGLSVALKFPFGNSAPAEKEEEENKNAKRGKE